MTCKAAALRYAAMGWPVLALVPGDKRPMADFFPRGVLDATTDARLIESIWKDRPAANLGIACERFVVIDIDPRNGGAERMSELVSKHARLPPTPTARTGGGGWHFLFEPPDFELRGKACDGVDVKKKGGYIVAPPSRTSAPYKWLRPPETPLAPLPAWLQALVRQPEASTPIPCHDLLDVSLERRIARAQAYLERCEVAVQGRNGSAWTLLIAQHVARGFMLPLEHAFYAMRDWNHRCQPPWSDRELKRKIAEALEKGRTVAPGEHLKQAG